MIGIEIKRGTTWRGRLDGERGEGGEGGGGYKINRSGNEYRVTIHSY